VKSPLSLEHHCVTEISLTATKADVVSKDFAVAATPYLAQSTENSLDWAIQLRVVIKPAPTDDPPPYTGAVTFFGNFRISENVPEESRRKIVATNGSSILYGAARELVANITARGPHPMITLPSISFVKAEAGEPSLKELPSKARKAKKTKGKGSNKD
jgi:preprotein translocase subunit SecB